MSQMVSSRTMHRRMDNVLTKFCEETKRHDNESLAQWLTSHPKELAKIEGTCTVIFLREKGLLI